MLSTLKRTITKSTLNTVEGTAYLCALCQCIVPVACATSTVNVMIDGNSLQNLCDTTIEYLCDMSETFGNVSI